MLSRRPDGRDKAQVVLVFGLSCARPQTRRASFLVYHPERRSLQPRLHPLNWRHLRGLVRFAVIRVRDDVLILGGYDTRRRKYKRQVLRYDLRYGRTYVCEKMVTPRADFTPFLLDGRVYCVGGRSRDGQLTRATEFYEPMMDRWYADEPLPVSCADYGVTVVDRDVFLIGGCVPAERAQQAASSHVWAMRKELRRGEDGNDEVVSVWTDLPTAAYPSSRGIHKHRCQYASDTQRIYVVGGSRDGGPANQSSPLPEANPDHPTDTGLYYIDLEDLQRCRTGKTGLKRIFWQRRAVDGCRRVGPGACVIGHRIFVVGGYRRPRVCRGSEVEVEEEGAAGGPDHSVGFYDWRTKRWEALFELGEDAGDLTEVALIHLEPNIVMKEFDFDRLDWMLQWALW